MMHSKYPMTFQLGAVIFLCSRTALFACVRNVLEVMSGTFHTKNQVYPLSTLDIKCILSRHWTGQCQCDVYFSVGHVCIFVSVAGMTSQCVKLLSLLVCHHTCLFINIKGACLASMYQSKITFGAAAFVDHEFQEPVYQCSVALSKEVFSAIVYCVDRYAGGL